MSDETAMGLMILSECCGKYGAHAGPDMAKMKMELAAVRAEVERLNRLAPLCEKCGSGTGTRLGCPYCALTELSHALSRIDYLCGEPNDMECSGYDVYMSPEAVIENVKRIKGQLAALSAANAGLRKAFLKLNAAFQPPSKLSDSLIREEMDAIRALLATPAPEPDAKDRRIGELEAAALEALNAIGDHGINQRQEPKAIAFLWDKQERTGKSVEQRLEAAFEKLQSVLQPKP